MGALLGSEVPVVGAPMAGGATTPALVAAVAGAGGFGFLAAGYKTPEAVRAEMDLVRGYGVEFGVNVFVPGSEAADETGFRRYAREIADEGRPYGLDLAAAPLVSDDDHWRDKIDLLLESPVPVVSFTFGLPGRDVVSALRRAGTRVLISVTNEAEARASHELGVDGLVVQSRDAGAHSAVHTPDTPLNPAPLGDLVRLVAAVTGLPVVATGGVTAPEQVRDLVAAGAAAVMVGTVLLRTDESGASEVHKNALADPAFTETVITRAFTGRPARGLRNAFIDRYEKGAPSMYPAVHHLTRGMRAAAARAQDPSRVHLWAGTGYRDAATGPAAPVVSGLASRL